MDAFNPRGLLLKLWYWGCDQTDSLSKLGCHSMVKVPLIESLPLPFHHPSLCIESFTACFFTPMRSYLSLAPYSLTFNDSASPPIFAYLITRIFQEHSVSPFLAYEEEHSTLLIQPCFPLIMMMMGIT